jgi:hypothetical protein
VRGIPGAQMVAAVHRAGQAGQPAAPQTAQTASTNPQHHLQHIFQIWFEMVCYWVLDLLGTPSHYTFLYTHIYATFTLGSYPPLPPRPKPVAAAAACSPLRYG